MKKNYNGIADVAADGNPRSGCRISGCEAAGE